MGENGEGVVEGEVGRTPLSHLLPPLSPAACTRQSRSPAYSAPNEATIMVLDPHSASSGGAGGTCEAWRGRRLEY